MTRYVYFVSYTGLTDSGFSVGCTDVWLDAPITTMDQVNEVRDVILSRNPENKTVTVTNFQLLRTED